MVRLQVVLLNSWTDALYLHSCIDANNPAPQRPSAKRMNHNPHQNPKTAGRTEYSEHIQRPPSYMSRGIANRCCPGAVLEYRRLSLTWTPPRKAACQAPYLSGASRRLRSPDWTELKVFGKRECTRPHLAT